MKKVTYLVLILFLYHISFSQIKFNDLVVYLKQPYDKLDESLSKKGFRFNGSTKHKDSSTSFLWINGREVIALKYTPDTISIIDPGLLGYLGYTDVIKTGIIYMIEKETTYARLLQEIKKSNYKKKGNALFNNTLKIEYENSEVVSSFFKQYENGKTTYGVNVEDKAYSILETHLVGF